MTSEKNIWKVAPGEGARLWDECLKHQCIAIGWNNVGDATQYQSEADLQAKLQELGYSDINTKVSRTSLNIWRFAMEMQVGDVIVANRGQTTVMGIGVVRSGYLSPEHSENPGFEYQQVRRVDWLIQEAVDVPFNFGIPTVLPVKDTQWPQIKSAYLKQNPALAPIFAQLEGDTPMKSQSIPPEFQAIFNHTRNVIFYGPPGTGKTYQARNLARALTDSFTPAQESPYVRTVTFHQSYGYEDFVEGLRPEVDAEGAISYAWHPGIFKRLCAKAAAQPEQKFVLLIDEINRGNIAKIFGELITLLEDDKRQGAKHEMSVTLPGSGETFSVPQNLLVIGTMNTADRSIALLDTALRRRFVFKEMPPQPELLTEVIAGVELASLLSNLNQRIERHLDRDHCVGHSYLMGLKTLADLEFVWYHKITPLLQEYFYNDGERLQAVLGGFISHHPATDGVFERDIYRVERLSGEAFVAVLKRSMFQYTFN
jgi:5-methylcytosine-specific restriction protein B